MTSLFSAQCAGWARQETQTARFSPCVVMMIELSGYEQVCEGDLWLSPEYKNVCVAVECKIMHDCGYRDLTVQYPRRFADWPTSGVGETCERRLRHVLSQ